MYLNVRILISVNICAYIVTRLYGITLFIFSPVCYCILTTIFYFLQPLSSHVRVGRCSQRTYFNRRLYGRWPLNTDRRYFNHDWPEYRLLDHSALLIGPYHTKYRSAVSIFKYNSRLICRLRSGLLRTFDACQTWFKRTTGFDLYIPALCIMRTFYWIWVTKIYNKNSKKMFALRMYAYTGATILRCNYIV